MDNNTEATENKKNVTDVKLSVIVPAYNSSKYISRCLDSLINQTLKEIEIVVVDDGSQDSTIQIVQEYQAKDSRIKLIEQEHRRQGAARNNGMKNACGEYIGFVDSDDWIDLEYYEKLYNAAKKYDSDIALAENLRVGNGKTKKRINIPEEIFVTKLQDKIDIGKQPSNPCPTNKIYRKSFLDANNIVWPEGCYCEDKMFRIQAVHYANGIAAVPEVHYYYFRNPNSTVKKRSKHHVKETKADKIKSKREVLEFLKSKKADIRDKDFWAITDICKIFGITLWIKKESLKTAKYYLFGFIKIAEISI